MAGTTIHTPLHLHFDVHPSAAARSVSQEDLGRRTTNQPVLESEITSIQGGATTQVTGWGTTQVPSHTHREGKQTQNTQAKRATLMSTNQSAKMGVCPLSHAGDHNKLIRHAIHSKTTTQTRARRSEKHANVNESNSAWVRARQTSHSYKAYK